MSSYNINAYNINNNLYNYNLYNTVFSQSGTQNVPNPGSFSVFAQNLNLLFTGPNSYTSQSQSNIQNSSNVLVDFNGGVHTVDLDTNSSHQITLGSTNGGTIVANLPSVDPNAFQFDIAPPNYGTSGGFSNLIKMTGPSGEEFFFDVDSVSVLTFGGSTAIGVSDLLNQLYSSNGTITPYSGNFSNPGNNPPPQPFNPNGAGSNNPYSTNTGTNTNNTGGTNGTSGTGGTNGTSGTGNASSTGPLSGGTVSAGPSSNTYTYTLPTGESYIVNNEVSQSELDALTQSIPTGVYITEKGSNSKLVDYNQNDTPFSNNPFPGVFILNAYQGQDVYYPYESGSNYNGSSYDYSARYYTGGPSVSGIPQGYNRLYIYLDNEGTTTTPTTTQPLDPANYDPNNTLHNQVFSHTEYGTPYTQPLDPNNFDPNNPNHACITVGYTNGQSYTQPLTPGSFDPNNPNHACITVGYTNGNPITTIINPNQYDPTNPNHSSTIVGYTIGGSTTSVIDPNQYDPTNPNHSSTIVGYTNGNSTTSVIGPNQYDPTNPNHSYTTTTVDNWQTYDLPVGWQPGDPLPNGVPADVVPVQNDFTTLTTFVQVTTQQLVGLNHVTNNISAYLHPELDGQLDGGVANHIIYGDYAGGNFTDSVIEGLFNSPTGTDYSVTSLFDTNNQVTLNSVDVVDEHCQTDGGYTWIAGDPFVGSDQVVGNGIDEDGNGIDDGDAAEITPNQGFYTIAEDPSYVLNAEVAEINVYDDNANDVAFTQYGYSFTNGTTAKIQGGVLEITEPGGNVIHLQQGEEYVVPGDDPNKPVGKFFYDFRPGGEGGTNEMRLVFEDYDYLSQSAKDELSNAGFSAFDISQMEPSITEATFGFRVPTESGTTNSTYAQSGGVSGNTPLTSNSDDVKTYYDFNLSKPGCSYFEEMVETCEPIYEDVTRWEPQDVEVPLWSYQKNCPTTETTYYETTYEQEPIYEYYETTYGQEPIYEYYETTYEQIPVMEYYETIYTEDPVMEYYETITPETPIYNYYETIPGTTETDWDLKNHTFASPLALDFDGDGDIDTTSIANGIQFDIDNDGTVDQTAWISTDEAMLAFDADNDGVVRNGGELFGIGTDIDNDGQADGYGNGFDALISYVADKMPQALADKKLSADEITQLENLPDSPLRLMLWNDASQSWELEKPSDHGITEISLDYQDISNNPITDSNGNQTRQLGSYKQNGADVDIALNDIYFQTLNGSGNTPDVLGTPNNTTNSGTTTSGTTPSTNSPATQPTLQEPASTGTGTNTNVPQPPPKVNNSPAVRPSTNTGNNQGLNPYTLASLGSLQGLNSLMGVNPASQSYNMPTYMNQGMPIANTMGVMGGFGQQQQMASFFMSVMYMMMSMYFPAFSSGAINNIVPYQQYSGR